MTYGRAATLGAVAGSGFAVGVALVTFAKAAYTITRAGHWYQLKHL